MRNDDRHQFHLKRADKLALTLTVIVLAVTVLFWAMIVVAAGVGGANHVLASTGVSWIEYGLFGIALLWAAMRAIGHARRGAARTPIARPAKAVEARHTLAAGSDLAAHHF
ncbi:MAG: hypothetical protein ACTHLR_11745 [Rhizomicrobium sp.]